MTAGPTHRSPHLHRLDRRTLLAGAAALTACALGARAGRAQSPRKLSLALDWYPNANHAGLFVAQKQGYFAAAGLELDLYTPADPTTVLQTVGAGKDDLGISYQTDVLLARAQGVPVVSVAAIAQRPLMCVMATKDQHITRPADLRGKTVGYPGIPSQEAFLATMLETDGARLSDVTLVNVGFDLVPAAISGRANAVMGAYWTHETILAEREGHPVDTLRVEDWGVPSYYELVLVASEETVAKRLPMLRQVVAAMRHGYDDAIADPAAALDTLAAAYPEVDQEVEREGLALLRPVWTDGGVPVGTQTPERWAAYASWMKERSLIPADLDEHPAYTTGALPPEPAATPAATPA